MFDNGIFVITTTKTIIINDTATYGRRRHPRMSL
jgi:hypothetical protein